MELKEVKRFIEELNQDKIVFGTHFYKRTGERHISARMVRSFYLILINWRELNRENAEELIYCLR